MFSPPAPARRDQPDTWRSWRGSALLRFRDPWLLLPKMTGRSEIELEVSHDQEVVVPEVPTPGRLWASEPLSRPFQRLRRWEYPRVEVMIRDRSTDRPVWLCKDKCTLIHWYPPSVTWQRERGHRALRNCTRSLATDPGRYKVC